MHGQPALQRIADQALARSKADQTEVVVTAVRTDKPITTLSTTITNQDGVVVLDGEAVVWRDPAVAAALPLPHRAECAADNVV